MSGFQPALNASSVMYFSIAPMVTAPKPSLSVQAPSHRRSCGQMRPQTSGSELVLCDSSAASNRLPSSISFSQFGNVVVDRALPLAERIAAGEAAPRLLAGAAGIVGRVDLAEVAHAHLHRHLRRIGARDVEELQVLVGHR